MDAQGTDQQKLLAFAQENRRLRHNLEQSKKDAAKAAEAALQEAERHAAERAADRAALEETFKAALREAEERHAAERAADRAALEASSRELNLLRVALMKEELARAKAEVEAAHMKGFERFKEEMLEAFSQPPEKAGLAAERGTPKPQVNCVCCGLPATGKMIWRLPVLSHCRHSRSMHRRCRPPSRPSRGCMSMRKRLMH